MNNLDKKEFNSIILGGSILSFNAGFVNACAIAGAYSIAVSHLTGNITKLGISIFDENESGILLLSSVIGAFVLGSFTAGYMVGDSSFKLGKSYGYALLLESYALLVA